MTTEITEDTFDAIIEGNTNVLVDCWAPWCGPCRRLGPIVEEIDSEYGSQVKVVKLNVDDAPGISARFDIQAIPTLLMFRNKILLKTLVGLRPKEEILSEMADAKLIEPAASGASARKEESAVAEVTDASFDSFVGGQGYALVDCWAPWCGPCRRMGPIVDELAEISKGEIRVGKLNTDDNQATAMRFNIASIPRLLIYKDGKLVDTIVGLDPGLTAVGLKRHVLEQ